LLSAANADCAAASELREQACAQLA